MAKRSADEVDELFAQPLSQFVSARNGLARRLREQGRTEEAAEVAALRKPTLPVWTANQLARRRRREVDLLLDAGHRLRQAASERDPQKARSSIERAREAEREALRQLRKAAADLLEQQEGAVSAAMIDRVAATLRAAAVTEEGRELLARGRLTQEISAIGFDLAAELAPKGRSRPRPSAHARAADEVASARAALQEARARQKQAERRLREAEQRANAARQALGEAEAAVEDARTEAGEATTAAEEARAAFDRARRSH